MDAEALDIYKDPEERLDYSDNQQRYVSPAPPEFPAKARDDCARHTENQEEATNVVSEREIAPADCARREIVPEEPNHE
jgi:hypothetical protein